MDFLQLADKTVVVMGVANRKSVAYHVAQDLCENNANVILVVVAARTAGSRSQKLFPDTPILSATSSMPEQIERLREELGRRVNARCTACCIRSPSPTMAMA